MAGCGAQTTPFFHTSSLPMVIGWAVGCYTIFTLQVVWDTLLGMRAGYCTGLFDSSLRVEGLSSRVSHLCSMRAKVGDGRRDADRRERRLGVSMQLRRSRGARRYGLVVLSSRNVNVRKSTIAS